MSWSTLPPELREVAERVLTDRELDVVRARATLGRDGEPLGWRTIGRLLSVDESTVRRTWERARWKIQEEFAAMRGLDNGR